MASIRSFIAVEIDQKNKEKLSLLISDLKKSNADVKWVNENQMHLTMKFLGNIEQDRVQKISDILKSIADDFKSFIIKFSGIGAFPDIRRPRVIWLGIDRGGESLKLLNNKIETALEKIGFAKERREYTSHLTLGRVRTSKNIQELRRAIDETTLQFQEEIKIEQLILFQSTLTPKGAVYKVLTEHLFSV